MTTTIISWQTTNDKEKTRMMIQHVMQWNATEDWSNLQSFPVAMWDEADQIWYVQHDRGYPPKPFGPLYDLNDAWLIVKRFTVGVELSYTPGRDCCCKIQTVIGEPVYGIAETAPEAICIAALRAAGFEVKQ